LVAGPIVRFDQVKDHLAGLVEWRPSRADFNTALGLICVGMGVKVLLADTLGNYIAPLQKQPGALGVDQAAYVTFAYSFQIYFDFYGYSLMAIGLGKLFGFTLPRNFADPYKALNPRDFWRRWHQTLSYWLRDYLYLPLGGNRRYVRNILIIFGVCGLWHGAGLTFVVWGLFHAGLVVAYHYSAPLWNMLPRLVQIGTNFVLVSLGWILFQFNFTEGANFAGSLIGQGSSSAAPITGEMWIVLLISALVCFGPNLDQVAAVRFDGRLPQAIASFAFALLFVLALLFIDRSQDFIYFRF
jgi:alginate O-acetyltransferase complex protein AlgI